MITAMMAGKEARVEYRLDRELPRVRISPEHFKQVVLNLVSNARKAVAAAG